MPHAGWSIGYCNDEHTGFSHSVSASKGRSHKPLSGIDAHVHDGQEGEQTSLRARASCAQLVLYHRR